jgi:hypothetical protein
MGSMSFLPFSLSSSSSLMETFDSRSMIGMYDCTAGRFRAVAAAFRRCLQDSSHGDVPIVKPWELETTLWKVCRVGREIRADWLVIQRWRTDSKELANTIRCLKSTKLFLHIQRLGDMPCFLAVLGRLAHTSLLIARLLWRGYFRTVTSYQRGERLGFLAGS